MMLDLTLLPTDILNNLNLVGRWTIKKIHGIDTIYSTNLGSSLKFEINHSQFLRLNCFDNGNYLGNPQEIAIRIDHLTWTRFPVNEPIELPLSDNQHLIEIMFAGNTDVDEIWTGKQGLAIKSIQTSKPAIITPYINQHQVTFIGDSITAGCWVNGQNASADYSPYANYVGICSDILQLDATYIAYSAAGLIRHGLGGVPTTNEYLTKLDSETYYPLKRPELIIVNLGTNDLIHSNQTFKLKLTDFYHQLTKLVPDSHYLFIIPFNQSFQSVFHEVFDHEPVILVETNDWQIPYTDQVHPNLAGSKIAGEKLAAIIQTQVFK